MTFARCIYCPKPLKFSTVANGHLECYRCRSLIKSRKRFAEQRMVGGYVAMAVRTMLDFSHPKSISIDKPIGCGERN